MVHRLRDVVVVIPGITGSVLVRDGREVWGLSGRALWSGLKSLGESVTNLKLTNDNIDDDVADGVTAVRVMEDFHVVPGLYKIEGYTHLVRSLHREFDIKRGNLSRDEPGNLHTFPYDWRRDNRVAARQLGRFVHDALVHWKASSGASDARVIILAHSMGGLVARYFLEVLDGWRNCRALITFGAPFRGSLNAVNYLANGYKQLFLDLTNVLRSCTSVYQLLPIYPVIDCGGEYKRVAELNQLPGIDGERAKRGLEFHREIEDAVTSNRLKAAYVNDGYRILPFVGVDQPTLQSANWNGNSIIMGRSLPGFDDQLLDGGDGIVPRCSATPLEMSDEFRETYHAERHGSLQSNAQIVFDVIRRIEQMQVARALKELRGSEPLVVTSQRARLSVDVDDAFAPGETVKIRAQLSNTDDRAASVIAQINSLHIASPIGVSRTEPMTQCENGWLQEVTGLPPGVYRLEVTTKRQRAIDPTPVHDIFEVVGG